MWLWSRPWPYAWLWGSGSDYQISATPLIAYITASAVDAVVSSDGTEIAKGHAGSDYVTASVSDYDSTEITWESAQVYYLSVTQEYSVSVVFDAQAVFTPDVLLTANISYILDQAGETAKTIAATDYFITASVTPVLALETSLSADYNLSAEVTEVTVSIFYQYSLSASYLISASVNAALQIVPGTVSKTVSNPYYITASASPSLRLNSDQRGKLVWKRKKGYYVYVPTSTA